MDQRIDELSRSFRGMLPRSLGNDTMENRIRGQTRGREHERQWTLFGQLLEDDGALRPRRASVAASTPNRPRASSHLGQPIPSSSAGFSAKRPLLVKSRSTSRNTPNARETSLDLPTPSFQLRAPLESSPSRADAIPPSDDDDNTLSGSSTAGSRECVHQLELPDHSRERDYDSTSDSEHDSDEPLPTIPPAPTAKSRQWLPSLTPLQKKVLKCSIAYTLGCMFTFVPALSNLLTDIVPLGSQQGPSPTGHMVATIGKINSSSTVRLPVLICI